MKAQSGKEEAKKEEKKDSNLTELKIRYSQSHLILETSLLLNVF